MMLLNQRQYQSVEPGWCIETAESCDRVEDWNSIRTIDAVDPFKIQGHKNTKMIHQGTDRPNLERITYTKHVCQGQVQATSKSAETTVAEKLKRRRLAFSGIVQLQEARKPCLL